MPSSALRAVRATPVARAQRALRDASFELPTLVSELVGGATAPGWLSPDGCRLYFQSNRIGNYDLYVASREPSTP